MYDLGARYQVGSTLQISSMLVNLLIQKDVKFKRPLDPAAFLWQIHSNHPPNYELNNCNLYNKLILHYDNYLQFITASQYYGYQNNGLNMFAQ